MRQSPAERHISFSERDTVESALHRDLVSAEEKSHGRYMNRAVIVAKRLSRTSKPGDGDIQTPLRTKNNLQDVTDDLSRVFVSTEQLLTLLPLCLDGVIFVQQLLKQVLLVKLSYQSILHHIFGVVDQQVHDGLGNLVGDSLAYDVEV